MRIACLALLAILPAAAEPIISFDFEDATLLKPPAKQVAAPGGHALQVDNADPGGSATVLFELPADQLAGRRVTLTAKVKADGVSTPPNPWNGVKVMLVVETAGGKQQHPQLPLPVGTYDWQTRERTLRLPAATTRVQLHLGWSSAPAQRPSTMSASASGSARAARHGSKRSTPATAWTGSGA